MPLKRIALWSAGAALLIFLILARGICGEGAEKLEKSDLYKQVELFADAITLIRSDYVDDVEAKKLIYGALKGMFSSLDGYSSFLDPESHKEIKEETKGEFGGLGIEIGIRDGILTVITPMPGTPAETAGLKATDRIIKIDAELTRDITLEEAVKKLRGKPGTAVKLTVLRESEKRLIEVAISRAVIRIESIRVSRMLEDSIGYVRLAEFQERTARELDKEIERLKKEGTDSLILDLRNNPGGLLESAVDVSEMFLAKDKIIVSTENRRKGEKTEFKARRQGKYTDFPLVVIVNEGSASGSEIVAGALQDNKRALILGAKTFGKGSVQTVIPLIDNSAVRLTTAEYFTPSGKSIRDKGVSPDVVVEWVSAPKAEEKEDAFKEIEKEYIKEEVKAEPAKDEAKELLSDNQIKAASDLLKGIKRFSGIVKNG